MYRAVRPLLFQLDAERSHDLALHALHWASKSQAALGLLRKLYADKTPSKPCTLMGLPLAHPLGLAAGLDKQGIAGNALFALGFSFIEYGTVTPKPQTGNPKPRLFRLPEHQALINRMGFNSIGLDAFLHNIQNSRKNIDSDTAPSKKRREKGKGIIGLNIGKNALTPIDKAADDYLIGLKAVYEMADYICINISSPNTQNLRELQDDAQLDQLLYQLKRQQNRLADQTGVYKPMALKIAPDLEAAQFDTISKALLKHGIDGLIASNTSLGRTAIGNHALAQEQGGLSGKPLARLSTKCIAQFHQRLQGEVPIIGVGGIFDAESAREKLEAGAVALQLYSSLIFQGPSIIKDIVRAL